MQIPDWAPRRPLALILVGCGIAGLLGGWFATSLPRQTALQHHESPWTPPRMADIQRFDDKAFQTLRLSSVWPAQGKAGGAAGTAAAGDAPAWSLVGIVLTPRPVALVLDAATAQVERIAAGSSLPDGTTLDKIERDFINVSGAGCKRRVELFHTPQNAGAGACASAAEAEASPADPGDHK